MNIKALIDVADPFFIIDKLSIKKEKVNDNTYSILCPDHDDKKLGSCKFDRKNKSYYCFSCGSYGNIIHLVRKTQNWSFIEACTYIADFYGGLSEFEDSDNNDLERKSLNIVFPTKILDFIGLFPYPGEIIDIKRFQEFKPNRDALKEYGEDYKTYLDGYGVYDFKTQGLYDLYKEDENTFYWLMLGKINESLEKIEFALTLDFSTLVQSDILYQAREKMKDYKYELSLRKMKIERELRKRGDNAV